MLQENQQCVGTLSREFVGALQIATSSVFYGLLFVLQKYAMSNGFGPFAFNSYRFTLSTIILFATKSCVIKIVHCEKNDEKIFPEGMTDEEIQSQETQNLWYWSFLAGFTMFGGTAFQQYGE